METVILYGATCALTALGLYDWHMMRNYREVQFKRKRK